MLLSNLLPGLRSFRAPLAAGYLWLLVLWLLFADSIPHPDQSGGVLQDFYTLASLATPALVLGAISFVAYLLGSVVEVNPSHPFWGLLDRANRYLTLQSSRLAGRLAVASYRLSSGRLVAPNKSGFTVVAHERRSYHQFSPSVAADLLRHIENLRAPIYELGVPTHLQGLDREVWSQWIASVMPAVDTWSTRCWAAYTRELPREIVLEQGQIVTKLRVSSPPLFEEYDRARGEAEFRLSVAPPLAALTILLGVTWDGRWLLGVIGVWILTASGLRRARAARDVVAQALLTDNVTSALWMSDQADGLDKQLFILDWSARNWVLIEFEDEEVGTNSVEIMRGLLRERLPKETLPSKNDS